MDGRQILDVRLMGGSLAGRRMQTDAPGFWVRGNGQWELYRVTELITPGGRAAEFTGTTAPLT